MITVQRSAVATQVRSPSWVQFLRTACSWFWFLLSWYQTTLNDTVIFTFKVLNLSIYTLKSNCPGFVHSPSLSDHHSLHYSLWRVLTAWSKTSQFILFDTGSGDVQKSPMWCLRSIGGNADEVEISTISTINIYSSISIVRWVNTGEGEERINNLD